MNVSRFFENFVTSANYLFRNPVMVLPGLALWGVLVGASKISEQMNYRFVTSISTGAWFVFFSLVVIAVMSLFFSGIIGMALNRKGRASLVDFFNYANKYWLRNFFVMVTLTIAGIVINRAVSLLAFYIGAVLNLSLGYAQALFLILYVVGIAGILLLFSFASFFLIAHDVSYQESFRRSRRFVFSHYPYVIVLSLILFGVYYLTSFLSSPVGEIIEYGILVPYLAILMTRFIQKQ